jgi:hypothetical protein
MKLPSFCWKVREKSLASATPKIQITAKKYDSTERHIGNHKIETKARQPKYDRGQPTPNKTPIGPRPGPETENPQTKKQRTTK